MKTNNQTLKVKAVQCLKCKDIIFSRALHDFHFCSCGKTAIDGGQTGYIRVCFDDKIGFKNVNLNLNMTLKKLYDDWNQRRNKFGLIRHKQL